jgi:hypothetical protein
MAVTQSLIVSGTDGLTITNDPTSTSFVIPEGGLAFPDFDMQVTYAPDIAGVPGSVYQEFALGIGSMPLSIDVRGTSMANLQANRRALEAAFSQSGETVTLSFGGQTEVYPFVPSWPRWGALNSGGLRALLVTATLTGPVNPLVVS